MDTESNLANAYRQALALASAQLAEKDGAQIALAANVPYDSGSDEFLVRYLGREYSVNRASGEVRFAQESGESIADTVKTLILHYLIHATPRPLCGKLISFKDIPGGGGIYAASFQKRAVSPLLKAFSSNKDALMRAAEFLGGERERYGHASVCLRIFPLVPVIYVVWEGDDEVVPSATILFDESITGFLPVEDIVLAASYGTYALLARSKG